MLRTCILCNVSYTNRSLFTISLVVVDACSIFFHITVIISDMKKICMKKPPVLVLFDQILLSNLYKLCSPFLFSMWAIYRAYKSWKDDELLISCIILLRITQHIVMSLSTISKVWWGSINNIILKIYQYFYELLSSISSLLKY